jgi:alginate lyase
MRARKSLSTGNKIKTILFACLFLLLAVVFSALVFNAKSKEREIAKSPTLVPVKDSSASIQNNLPAGKLNLANWKLTLPIDTDNNDAADEIKQPALSSFSQAPYFIAATDGVIFRANAGGATTDNSGYPRSELREMTYNGRKRASWSNESGSHTMTIKQAITHLPVVKPELVAGQIHDDSDDIVMIRLENTHLFVEANGKNIGDLEFNYQLGTIFTVKIVAKDSMINIFYNDVQKVAYDKKGSDYYFKAGCYTQSNVDKGDDPAAYGEVKIYDLVVQHT